MPNKKSDALRGTPGNDKGKEEQAIAVAETNEDEIEARMESFVENLVTSEGRVRRGHGYMAKAYRMNVWEEIQGNAQLVEPVNDNHAEKLRRSVAMSKLQALKEIVQEGQVGPLFRGGHAYEVCKRIEKILDEFEREIGDARAFGIAPMQATYLPHETLKMVENGHKQLEREWERMRGQLDEYDDDYWKFLAAYPGKPVMVEDPDQMTWRQVEYYIKVLRFLEKGSRIEPKLFIQYLSEIFVETWKANPELGFNDLLERTLWWIPESVFDVLPKAKDRFDLIEKLMSKGQFWRRVWEGTNWAKSSREMFPTWERVLSELSGSSFADGPDKPFRRIRRGRKESGSKGDDGNRSGGHRTEREGKHDQERHKGSGDDKNKYREQPKTIDDEKFVKFANRLHTGQCVGCGAENHPLRECKGAEPEAGTFLRLRQADPSQYRERLDRLLPLTDEERAAKRSWKNETGMPGRDQAERSNGERGMVKSMGLVAASRGSEVTAVLHQRLLIYPQNMTGEKQDTPVE